MSARPRLTSHQAEVLTSLRQRSRHQRDRWVSGADIGSVGALARLVAKGYAEHRTESGPRGGELPFYRPVRLPGECWCGSRARPGWTTCTPHYSSGRAR